MSGLQKPFANEKKPEAAPVKKGGFFGKLIKLIVLAIILGLVGSMVWNGKKMGEADAAMAWDKNHPADQTRDQAIANGGIVWPWKWSTPQWEAWFNQTKSTVTQAGQSAATTITEKAKQAKAELDAYIAKRKAAQPASTTTTTTQPTTATNGTTGGAATTPATTPAPMSDSSAADLKKADDLIAQGGDLFNDKPADAQKKLEEAVGILKPYTQKSPVDPAMQEAYDRATNTIDALKQRQY